MNATVDFINLQTYGGISPSRMTGIGISPNILAYGVLFEGPNNDPNLTNANQAFATMLEGFTYNKQQYPYNIVTVWRLNSGNYNCEQSQQILLYGLVHNNQGGSFNDVPVISAAGNPPITQLVVRSGEVLDAIWATNTTSNNTVYNLLQHGGNGGAITNPPLTFKANKPIVKITGYTGTWFGWNVVLQITLYTADGTPYGPYGTMANTSSKTPFTHTAPSGQSLVAFSGTTVLVPEAVGGKSYVVQSLNVSFG